MPRGLLSVPEWGLSLCSMSSPGPSSPDGAGGKSTEPTKSQFFRPMQKGRMTFSQGLLSMLGLGSARKRRSSFSLPRAWAAAAGGGASGGNPHEPRQGESSCDGRGSGGASFVARFSGGIWISRFSLLSGIAGQEGDGGEGEATLWDLTMFRGPLSQGLDAVWGGSNLEKSLVF